MLPWLFSMICMKINKGNSSRMCVGEIKVKDVDAGCIAAQRSCIVFCFWTLNVPIPLRFYFH
jgi:hypothetical protein